MRTGIVMLTILVMFGTSMAKDRPTRNYVPPENPKQGGDTVFDALVISSLPYSDTGTTFGYLDDYDEVCPYSDSTSPDVVYSYTPDYDISLIVDLCGSSYDTKVYVYDSDLNLVACNDDYYFELPCGLYVSYLEFVEVIGGETYYIVIDGYGGESGDYILAVHDIWHCEIDCPPDFVDEGEPELTEGYVDAYNGGCDSPEAGTPFQDINWTNDEDGYPPYDGTAWLCGTSGWYLEPSGEVASDSDWFRVYALQSGAMEITLRSEFDCILSKMSPTSCPETEVEIDVYATCYFTESMPFLVTAGEEIWLCVKPSWVGYGPEEFTYLMTVTNNTFDTVPTEEMSWGGVKALYR